jgi:rhamnosyltransferase
MRGVTPDATESAASRAASVVAIVVLYHPDPRALLPAAQAWLDQVDLLLCVDNGGGGEVRERLESLAPDRVSFLEMGFNAGVGAAHNRGIDEARRLGATHMLLGDQDSVPGPDMVAALLDAERRALAAGQRVAAVGPRYVDVDSGRHSYFVRCGPVSFRRIRCTCENDWVVADFLISSGALIRTEALQAVGPMDEGLFIDLVDTEWFLRAKSKGWVAIGACGAWMAHHLGEETLVIHLPRTRTLPVHKPFRYYYMFRNSVLLYRRQYAPWSWIVPDLARLAQLVVFFGFIHRARSRNLRMMVQGVRDGLRGASGSRPVDMDQVSGR